MAYRALSKAEDIRHVLQHFDKFIQKSIENDFSPLGAVTALKYLDENNVEFYSFVPGSIKSNNVAGTTDLNQRFVDKVDHVTLEFYEQKLNLSEIARTLQKYYEYLRSEIASKYKKT